MENKNIVLNFIQIIIIAGSIIFSSYFVSNAIVKNKKTENNNDVLTQQELAEYLSISDKELNEIIKEDTLEKSSITNGQWDTYQFIPYINFNDENRFLISEIKKWLEYQSVNIE